MFPTYRTAVLLYRETGVTLLFYFFSSYCSGQTLYTYVRTNAREKFNMNKTIMIAQQIAQVSVLSDSVINGYKKRYFACLKKAYMIIYLTTWMT